jgi:predicted dehydrogenase
MIKIGMLSCGHVHTKGYCESIAKLDDCELAVVWDDMPDRGQEFANTYGSEYSADLDGTVARDDIDGFIICAENTRHLPLLRAAIPAGKPIFCEKPLTTSVADAKETMALIREHNAKVTLGYFQPFSAELQAVAGLLADGALGTVTHARYRNAHHAAYGRWFDSPANAWFTQPDLAGGGAFMDMGAHAVHAVRTLLGPVKSVWAQISNVSGEYPDVDDYGIAHLEFESGVACVVEASWVQTGGIRGMEIVGSKATLYQLPERGYVTAAPQEEPAPVAPAEPKPTHVARLVAAIRGELTDDELAADLAASVDAVAIIQACYASSQTGAWVDVERSV